MFLLICSFFFFFNDTATTEIYTLSLHDALPIYVNRRACPFPGTSRTGRGRASHSGGRDSPAPGSRSPSPAHRYRDRKSTRLNSSHSQISYAVFCLKKKKKNQQT